MAAELVNLATSEKLKETDWAKCIEICELVNRDQGLAKDVIKAIKKRLGHKNPHTQIYAVTLLEMLMNNCGEHIHRQVIDSGLLPKMVKIVKKKSDLPVREKIFLLLDATQTSLGGASGKFPQYYAAYYDLVCARVKFPQCSAVNPQNLPTPKPRQNNLPARTSVSPKCEGLAQQSTHQSMPESSIIHKASSALEVLRQVLDALDPQHPEDAANEFTLDLVEQCSFQKQRVMHLVMTSQDEMVVSQAIELNEQLQKVLAKHDALLSIRTTSRTAALNREEAEEEEEADSLFRRVRKGKACARAGDEDGSGSSSSSLDQAMGEKLLRPQVFRPIRLEPLEPRALPAGVVIPPPPAKHRERERFFKEKGVAGQMNGLSLHSRTGSSSHTGSTESSE